MLAMQHRNTILAALAGGAIALLWWRNSRSRSSEDDDEDWEPVDQDHVVKFFQILNDQSQVQMASFNQQIAQYRGKIDERQLTDLAISHFEEQLSKNQQQILSGIGVSEEDMEDASNYYEQEGDPMVKEQIAKLKSLYLATSNASAVEAPKLPDDLTAEKMVVVIGAFFQASNQCIRDVIADLVAQGKSPTNPNTAREMGLMLQMRNGPATDEAIKRFNLDSSTIGPAMEKFQDHPEIQDAIRAGNEEQREILQSFGLA